MNEYTGVSGKGGYDNLDANDDDLGDALTTTVTTPRLRRGTASTTTTSTGSNHVTTNTTSIRFLPSSVPITATDTAIGMPLPQPKHPPATVIAGSTYTRRRNIFRNYKRHGNNNMACDCHPIVVGSFHNKHYCCVCCGSNYNRNRILRNRFIGIGILLSFILYVLVQHPMTVDLHKMLLRKNEMNLDIWMKQSSVPTKQEYRWKLCDPLGSINSNNNENVECYYHNTTTTTSTTTGTLHQPTILLLNNSFSMTRYVCHNISLAAYTHIIVPSSTLACFDKFNQHSPQPPLILTASSRLFEFPPLDLATTSSSLLSTGNANVWRQQHQQPISPIKVRFGRRTPTQLFPDCDIPCYHDGEPISDRYVDALNGTWTISYSMEGPQYWESIYIQPQAWRENRFWSTTSYKSEIPLPYYDNVTFHIWHNDYVPYNTGIKGGVFMAFNCDSKNHREQLVKDMISKHFRVDAISSCLHNADPPNGMNNELSDKISIMKQYLFYLAFENQCEDDYITEKLWGAYEAGTIPIYYGAPNVKDHVPNHSLILVNDYNNTHELVQHLMAILNNQQLYESYHLWRTQPILEHFHTKYDLTATHSTCRTCRWAYARMYGIGWNHTSQSLRPLHIGFSRQVCFSSLIQSNDNHDHPTNYLVQHPFVEEWYGDNGRVLAVEPAALSAVLFNHNTTCPHPLTGANSVVDINSGLLQRTLYNHDGVIDLVIRMGAAESGSDGLMLQEQVKLRLRFPLLQGRVRLRNIRSGVWQVQNEKSRFTLLFATSFSPSVDTVVTQITDTTYDIAIVSPIRLRVIIEDVDTFHEGANDVENFFGKLLAEDFFNPIQVSVRKSVN